MVSRTSGILCDKEFEKNCLDYVAMPVGMANAQFSPVPNNPLYDGIKPPKHQQMASRPVSIDVQAVNRSRLIAGDKFVTAGSIMDEIQNDSKNFNPPQVSINQPPPHNEQLASVAQPNVSGLSRGEQILTRSIGTQMDGVDKYLSAFYNLKRTAQISAIRSIYKTLTENNIDLPSYGVDVKKFTGNISNRSGQVERLFEASLVSDAVIDWNTIFSTPVNREESTTSNVMTKSID